jgi:hypothetical protein
VWTWHWWLFFTLLIACFFMVAFSRGAMNRANMQTLGDKADYARAFREEPFSIMGGTLVAAAIWAGLFTAIAGFLF